MADIYILNIVNNNKVKCNIYFNYRITEIKLKKLFELDKNNNLQIKFARFVALNVY